MNILDALAQATDQQVVANDFAQGYTAYAGEFDTGESAIFTVKFCAGAMPPHKTVDFPTQTEMVAWLQAEELDAGWYIEEAE